MLFILMALGFGLTMAAVNSIVVERNYHLYFRVPISLNNATSNINGVKKYNILQCPHDIHNNELIPKPQDMPICITVGTYAEVVKQQQHQPSFVATKVRPESKLRTKVNYTHLKKIQRISSVRKTPTPSPPLQQTKRYHKKTRDRRENVHNDQLSASSSTRIKQQQQQQYENSDDLGNKEKAITNSEASEKTEKTDMNDIIEDDPLSEEYADDDNEDYYEEDSERSDEANAKNNTTSNKELSSPLKYIGVRDLIRKFAKNSEKELYASDNTNNRSELDDDFSLESQRFFINHETFSNGDKWKGYQNSFHRDEFYNDHIFYDDESDDGNFHERSKMHRQI